MGSKNLKAIAVRGTGEIQINDPKGLLDSSYRIVEWVSRKNRRSRLWHEHGATTDSIGSRTIGR